MPATVQASCREASGGMSRAGTLGRFPKSAATKAASSKGTPGMAQTLLVDSRTFESLPGRTEKGSSTEPPRAALAVWEIGCSLPTLGIDRVGQVGIPTQWRHAQGSRAPASTPAARLQSMQ